MKQNEMVSGVSLSTNRRGGADRSVVRDYLATLGNRPFCRHSWTQDAIAIARYEFIMVDMALGSTRSVQTIHFPPLLYR